MSGRAKVEDTAIKTTDNAAYEVMKQGVGEPENEYEMVDGPPDDQGSEKYEVPILSPESLPAMPTVGRVGEPKSLPPVTGEGEEEDKMHEN